MQNGRVPCLKRGSSLAHLLMVLFGLLLALGLCAALVSCGDFKSIINQAQPLTGGGGEDGNDGGVVDGPPIPTPAPTIAPSPTPTPAPTPTPPPGAHAYIEEFVQLPANKLVDILFVVDNSGSMESEQENLGDNFGFFISALVNKDYDFQVGIITTDASEGGRLRRHSATGTTILTRHTPNLTTVFSQIMASLGTGGSWMEQGLKTAWLALNLHENAALVREQAMLNIIFVSDEQDVSGFSSGDPDNYLASPEIPNMTPADFVGRFQSIKNGNGNMIRAHAVVARGNPNDPNELPRDYNPATPTQDYECPNRLGVIDKGVHNLGTRYVEVATALNGVKASICSATFYDALGQIGQNIVANNMFVLARSVIAGTLEVRVAGVVVSDSDYNYVEASHSIVFKAGREPADGASVKINYQSLEE